MTQPASYPNPALAHWRLPDGVPGPNLWYRLMRRVFQATMCPAWKIRVFNRHYEPACGGAVYICNHQSYLDPMLMSLALCRPMNYMARETLFRFPIFRQIIRSLNAFPVRPGEADTGALKEAMRRLRRGEQLVVFPEGTRTSDGRIGHFLPGVAILAQRAAEWTVPVLIEGAFEAWPRWQRLPRPGSVIVQYGRPIDSSEARTFPPREFARHLRQEIISIQTAVRRRTGRSELKYD